MPRTRTVTRSSTAQPPPRAGALHPNGDAYQLASDALAEALSLRDTVQERTAHVVTLRDRVHAGSRWLATNDEEHPRHRRNSRLLLKLRWEHTESRWAMRDAEMRFVDRSLAFFTAYDSLTPIEQQVLDTKELERPDSVLWSQLNDNWHLLGVEV